MMFLFLFSVQVKICLSLRTQIGIVLSAAGGIQTNQNLPLVFYQTIFVQIFYGYRLIKVS